MAIPVWLWVATVGVLVGAIVVDVIVVERRPHVFTVAEASRWVAVYVTLALLFAGALAIGLGVQSAGEFLAGYITEYSLSMDNLFVFMVIMSAFAVPPEFQHRVLLVGIVIALALRGVLIVAGAQVIENFAGAFYLFGAFMLWTAFQVWNSEDEEPDPEGNALVRFVERHLPVTRDYHGSALIARIGGRRFVTPMLLVMLSIGTTDLLFAMDSIPAVFGLTQEPYIVFCANAFALMGLRQLYFMLHGLLDRLVYLPKGLAFILGFIGVKLLLHAVHETTPLEVPEISIAASLLFIIGTLAVTSVLSIRAVKRNPALVAGSLEARAEAEALTVTGEAILHLPPEAYESDDTAGGAHDRS